MEKKNADLIIKGGMVVTIDSERRIISDGAIAVRDGTITGVGKTSEIEAAFQAATTIDASANVVMPGYVDSHVHLTEHICRGFVPDSVAAEPWVFQWILPYYHSLTPEEEYYSALLAFVEFIRRGTTTFCEAGAISDIAAVVDAMGQAGIRGAIGPWCWDRPKKYPRFEMSTDEALKRTEAAMARFQGSHGGRVHVWPFLIGAGTASPELLNGAKALADRYRVSLTMHHRAREAETQDWIRETGKSSIQHFGDSGLLGPNLRLIHLIDATDEEIQLLKEYDVKVIHCPTTALRLGYGATRLGRFPEMLSKGVCVSLGCDGANCSNGFDMGRAVYLAAGLYKDCRMDVSMIPAEVALEMGTINGARSMLLDGSIGSIEVGKRADLVLFDRRRPEWVPMLDVINNLVYAADGKSVETVIIDGRIVMEKGELKTLDEALIYEKVERMAPAILDRVGLQPKSRWKVY